MNTYISLLGLHILITRPEQQAVAICQRLTQAGAIASCLPVIEIVPPLDTDKADNALQQIDKYDNVIFISRNAVVWTFRMHEVLAAAALSKCRVGAIGNRTASALRQFGLPPDDIPTTGFNSEHFLALDSMQADCMFRRNVLIVRGQGGRELLAQTLRQRGASVAYAEVYRRVCPSPIVAQRVLHIQQERPLDVIAVTSCEGLHNLLSLLQSPDWLFATPLLVGSQRIASEACQLGFKADVVVAADPGDDSMLQALSGWRQGRVYDR